MVYIARSIFFYLRLSHYFSILILVVVNDFLYYLLTQIIFNLFNLIFASKF